MQGDRQTGQTDIGHSLHASRELGLRELINADQRKTLAAAFGSQPDLQSAPRQRLGSDQARNSCCSSLSSC